MMPTQPLFRLFARYGAAGVGTVVWFGLLLILGRVLLSHSYQPTVAASALPVSSVNGEPGAPSLVMFVHPLCPCSSASLHELSESLARLPTETHVRLVFVTAGLSPVEIARSALVETATALPGVTVAFDDTGSTADRFGATVSGEAFAFDHHGNLAFHGGLTPARGHQGDALGQAHLEKVLQGGCPPYCAAAVYGCSLPRLP